MLKGEGGEGLKLYYSGLGMIQGAHAFLRIPNKTFIRPL